MIPSDLRDWIEISNNHSRLRVSCLVFCTVMYYRLAVKQTLGHLLQFTQEEEAALGSRPKYLAYYMESPTHLY